jgi:hypothetical protein
VYDWEGHDGDGIGIVAEIEAIGSFSRAHRAIIGDGLLSALRGSFCSQERTKLDSDYSGSGRVYNFSIMSYPGLLQYSNLLALIRHSVVYY